MALILKRGKGIGPVPRSTLACRKRVRMNGITPLVKCEIQRTLLSLEGSLDIYLMYSILLVFCYCFSSGLFISTCGEVGTPLKVTVLVGLK